MNPGETTPAPLAPAQRLAPRRAGPSARTLATACVLFALLPGVARAGGSHLTLGTAAGYEGVAYDAAWMDRTEHAFEEEVRVAWDSHIVSRTFARYHLGVALDNRTLLDGGNVDNTLAWQYDARLDFWKKGTVPVTLFGARQVQNLGGGDGVPSFRATSDLAGFNAGFHPYRLPSVNTRGWWQAVETRSDDVVSRQSTAALSGAVSQSANAAVARAAVDWTRHAGPGDDQVRETRTGALNVDYRASDKVEIVGRGTSRSYSTSYGDVPLDIGTQDADAIVRFRLDKRTRGQAYVQQYRSVFADAGYGGLGTGVTASRDFDKGFRGQADAGVTYDVMDEATGTSRFAGEHLRLQGSQGAGGTWGGYEVVAAAGTAYFTELGEGGGLQNAGAVAANANKSLLGNYLRLNAGGEVRRQWDASPQNLDFLGWGWQAGVSTRQMFGLTLSAQANQTIVDQLSQEEGDSDRIRVYGIASHGVRSSLKTTYTFAVERARLDEESSQSVGHTARVDAKVSQYFNVAGMLYQSSWASSAYEPWSWWRAEALAAFVTHKFVLEGRVSYDWAGGQGTAERGTLFGQLVVSRRFDWDI